MIWSIEYVGVVSKRLVHFVACIGVAKWGVLLHFAAQKALIWINMRRKVYIPALFVVTIKYGQEEVYPHTAAPLNFIWAGKGVPPHFLLPLLIWYGQEKCTPTLYASLLILIRAGKSVPPHSLVPHHSFIEAGKSVPLHSFLPEEQRQGLGVPPH